MNRYRPLLSALLVCLAIMASDRWGHFQYYSNTLELNSYNLRQRLLAHESSAPYLIGGIDEESIEMLGRFPWDRDLYAFLLSDLRSRGVSGVFFDLIFDRERDEDEEFAGALAEDFSVVAGTVTKVMGRLAPPILSPPIAQASTVGLVNKSEDVDEAVRFTWMAIGVNNKEWPNTPLLSASLVIYAHYLGVDPESIEFEVDGLPFETVLPNISDYPRIETRGRIIIGEMSIPVRVGLNREDEAIFFLLPIKYSSPQTYLAPSRGSAVSFAALPETDVDGLYVFIGENSQSDVDVVSTPTGHMKGVEAHAQAFAALVDQQYLRLVWYPNLITLFIALVMFALLVRVHTGRAIAFRCTAAAVVYLLLNLLAFKLAWWIPVSLPLFQIFFTGGVLVFFQTEVARNTFANLTTREAAAEMLVSETGDKLEATTIDATIIVSDIRGYTTLSETRTPVEMLELLNQYHTTTVAIYERYGGRALTYQGDAQLIVFGYPNKIANPARASVEAAVALQEAVTELRELWNVTSDTFSVGAACCTGSVAIGRLGAPGAQFQYTVIGEPVRRAHKVQSLSDVLDSPVLLDPETAAEIGDTLPLEDLGVIDVPGLEPPLRLYRPINRS